MSEKICLTTLLVLTISIFLANRYHFRINLACSYTIIYHLSKENGAKEVFPVERRINSIWKSEGKNVGKQTCNRHRFELSLRALLVDVVVSFFSTLSCFAMETFEMKEKTWWRKTKHLSLFLVERYWKRRVLFSMLLKQDLNDCPAWQEAERARLKSSKALLNVHE